MAKITRNFVKGIMNKVVDERLVPNGEYIDALNIRMGSTEDSEIGVIENTKGNILLTDLSYNSIKLSIDAVTIGVVTDTAKETIIWFVHDPNFPIGATGKLDMIVSFNVFTSILTYHIVSIDDGDNVDTTLNFNPTYLITGINIVDDLVFWTDDYNQPRFINRKRIYPTPTINIDDPIIKESILVIKKPPTESPTIELTLVGGENNFMQNRFLCFAYRYKYADNEYSATSQFSAPAFVPNQFSFSRESYLNEGMLNYFNTAIVSYNTGDSLVVGIDLLFKEAQSNIIKIITKINKKDSGIGDFQTEQYTFTNSKIYTLLPAYEILRTYDNVPLLAKAQTLMGNRLMYGNYVEGYNIVNSNNTPVNIDFSVDLLSEPIAVTQLNDTLTTGNYTIDPTAFVAVNDSIINIDFTGVVLESGANVTVDFDFEHSQFSGGATPTETTENIAITLSVNLSQSYSSVYAFSISSEFINAVQSLNAISCDGVSITDRMNCLLPQNLDTYTKTESGISNGNQPISIVCNPGDFIIKLQLIAMRYVNTISPFDNVYEYYKVTYAEAFYQLISNTKSLHSNRDYEVGIVYMDEFNRASTALISDSNTIHVPCNNSGNKNSIIATIPYLAPYWAKRYKFVIKATTENYETIYSSIFFKDPLTPNAYFLLEGENAQKVEVGDRYIVKSDSEGIQQTCTYATVLEKDVKPVNFIEIPSPQDPLVNIPIPSGVYMKINPNGFNTVYDPDAFITYGTKTASAIPNACPSIFYPVSKQDTSGAWGDYSIPTGSTIKLHFKFERLGTGDGNNACEKRVYELNKKLVSSQDYDSFQDWWNGDDVAGILNSGYSNIGNDTSQSINNIYYPNTHTFPGSLGWPCDLSNRYIFTIEPSVNPGLTELYVRGPNSCTGGGFDNPKKRSKLSINIEVFRNLDVFIFETEPLDALPEIFYENDLSFAINDNHEHEGNISNQDIALGLPAVIDTNFFNCYAFGNGVESYKVRDSIIGQTFNLGNRVSVISPQIYKEIDRFADITYSGVYNDESNINKFNEFNLGLLNYKPLEDAFGPIYILDGRQTDVLAIQEDRVSYVLTGKNLLSDSTGGGALTSVPEVLGTQIARTEKYGISMNPESYVNWGYNRYFTDAKRGAVIEILGNSYTNDTLKVISENGMRTWFRDTFIDTLNNQKVGGYDPYMNEYVLSINEREIPNPQTCIDCGIIQTIYVDALKPVSYCVNLSQLVGSVEISYNVTFEDIVDDFIVTGTYNEIPVTSGPVQASGSIFIDKNLIDVQTLFIDIQATSTIYLEINIACPVSELIHVIKLCITSNSNAGEYIHNESMYTYGTFVSPTQSDFVTFLTSTNTPVVSFYNEVQGYPGAGNIPVDGSTVRLTCRKTSIDTFNFDPLNNGFRYLRSDVLYNNTPIEISALISNSIEIVPNMGSGNNNYGEFTMPSLGDYLYLIYDYTTASAATLCFSNISMVDACCDCTPCESNCSEYFVSNSVSLITPNATISYEDCDTGLISEIVMDINKGYFVCTNSGYPAQITSGEATVALISSCGCNTCLSNCFTFTVEVMEEASITWTSCDGPAIITQTFAPGIYPFCALESPYATSGKILISYSHCGCA
jgi:hypothetical protein